jgi:predicted RNA polymerase sigma factor
MPFTLFAVRVCPCEAFKRFITTNLTIDSLRRKCRRSEVEIDDAIPSFLHGPGVNCERAEIREQVYAALAQLTPEHRAAIVLKEIEDLQYREIAEILNVTIGTVMSYGRKKLQSILIPIFTPVEVKKKEKQRFSCNAAVALHKQRPDMTKSELQVALAAATETTKRTAGVFLDTLSNLA